MGPIREADHTANWENTGYGIGAQPLSQRALLLHLLTHSAEVQRAFDEVKEFHPHFPAYGNTPFVWHMLRLVGRIVPFSPYPEGLLFNVLQTGAHVIDHATHKVMPLDLYVLAVGTNVAGIGFVIKELESKPGRFLGIDHRATRPQVFTIGGRVRGFVNLGYT